MNNKTTSAWLSRGLVLALAAGYTGELLAEPSRPDAGQTLQQLQGELLPTPEIKPVAPVQVDEKAATETVTDSQARFLVKRIHVVGSTAFPAAQLESLIVSLAGSEQSMTSLNEAARLITRFYRHNGYLVARAYVPAQTVTDGEVTIRVLEGKLGNITLNNHSMVRDSHVNGYTQSHLKTGEPLTTDRLNQTLLLLNDVPGVGRAQGALQAGKTVGASDLTLYVPPDKRWQGEIMLDNYGNRYTGQNILSGHLVLNSPLQIGDRLDMRTSLSDESLVYGRVSWDAPVGYEGMRAGLDLSYSQYELGDIFTSLEAQGTAQTYRGYLSYPVLIDLKNRVSTFFSIRQRNLEDEIGLFDVTTERNLQDVVIGFGGAHLGTRQTMSWQVEGSMGKLSIDTPDALAIDQLTAKTDGSYAKLTAGARALRAVSEYISVYLSFNAQAANHNLDSSEKFTLGGINGVRAYPYGEGLGDEGWLGTFEVRSKVLPTLQLFALYDAGSIRINHDPFVISSNTRRLSGTGVGFNASFPDSFSLKMTVAWRGDEKPLSDQDERPRVWLQGKYQF